MKKTVILSAALAAALLSSCAGRDPQPVMAMQYGDPQKTCKELEYEIQMIEGEINRLVPHTDKTGQNVALGVAGWFFLVPWFFMDFKNAEKVEYEAYRQRYNNLSAIANSKDCMVKSNAYPSVQEIEEIKQRNMQIIEESRTQ